MSQSLGAGPMWNGAPHPSGKAEYPAPTRIGTAIGEHLRVESLFRVAEGRLYYLTNNLGPKWSRRKCWSCGNKYSPELSKCCSFCLTPLRDVRLLACERWEPEGYRPFEEYAALRLSHMGLITPVAIYHRNNRMVSIYHYNGEHLLSDEPSPLHPDRLVMAGRLLTRVLEYLHQNGVVLARIAPQHLLVMPDDSVRFVDIDVEAVLPDEVSVKRRFARSGEKDAHALCDMLLRLCPPEDVQVRAVLERGAAGKLGGAATIGDAFEDLLARSGARPNPHSAAQSDVGLVRKVNEDSWTWRRLSEPAVLYVVCDGMGGHDDGEVASRIACRTVSEALSSLPAQASPDKIEAALNEAIVAANQEIRAWGRKNHAELGTTIVAAVVSGRRSAVIAHAGDSRAYLSSGGQLRQVTKDHNLARERMEQKKLSAADAWATPNANVLTSSLGAEDDDLVVEINRVELKPGDRLLLCSDGVWGPLGDAQIAAILRDNRSRTNAVHALLKGAIDAGGPDNCTAIVVDG